jgi:hypothetical protein
MTLSPSTPLMHSSQYNYLNDTGNTSSAMMGQPAMSGAAPSMVNALKSYHFPEGVRSSSSLLELFQCSSPDRTSAAAAQPFAALNQNPAMDSTINMAAQTSICSDISMVIFDYTF